MEIIYDELIAKSSFTLPLFNSQLYDRNDGEATSYLKEKIIVVISTINKSKSGIIVKDHVITDLINNKMN